MHVGIARSGAQHRELVATTAAANGVRRQHLLQPPGNRDNELVGAEHAKLGVDVGHAVELDQRETRDLLAGALGQSEIQQFERLGVIGQPGELVGVGGAAGQLLARRQIAARALELAQREAGEAHQHDRDAADHRQQPVHRQRHRMRLVPGEEAGDAPLPIQHRLYLALTRRRLGLELEAVQARALLDHVDETRINRAGLAEQHAKFSDGIAQGGALLGPQLLVAALRQAIADHRAAKRRARGDDGEQHDQPRGRKQFQRTRPRCADAAGGRAPPPCQSKQRAPGFRARRLRYGFAVHRKTPEARGP